VHVSAKDLGTGNQQEVTITASTNLNESEIKKAVAEAEKFAEEDKKRKADVEAKNHADQLIYSTEKTMKELGDKLDAADKENIEKAVGDLKTAMSGEDIDLIKTATERLTDVSYAAFGKIYQNASAGQQPHGAEGASSSAEPPHDDTVVDADYEVVNDDK